MEAIFLFAGAIETNAGSHAELKRPGSSLAVAPVRAELATPILVCSGAIRDVRRAMQSALPGECCGLLIGRRGGRARPAEVSQALSIRNEHRDHFRFELDPLQSIQAERKAREHGDDLVGYFHSHPQGDPAPSRRDLRSALWGGLGPNLHLIISPTHGWRMFRIHEAGWSIARTCVFSRPVFQIPVLAPGSASRSRHPGGSLHA
jgi:proteasome lid subunit RPN8/RPN11